MLMMIDGCYAFSSIFYLDTLDVLIEHLDVSILNVSIL